MFYSFLRVLANIVIRLYYRRIYISGLENIPTDKPVMIASNHPNGFLEPIIMACIWPRDLSFLVRGDLYDNKFLQPLLKATNEIPIYRFKDGFASLRNNQKTIQTVVDQLKASRHIIIFIEGGTEAVKYLRPFKKGMARMAYQATKSDESLDIQILPSGINFTDGKKFRSDVFLNIGNPISFKAYYQDGQLDEKRLLDVVTEDTFQSMRPLVFDEKERPQALGKSCENLIGELEKSDRIVQKSNKFYNILEIINNYKQKNNNSLYPLENEMVKIKGKWYQLLLSLILAPLALLALLFYLPSIFLGWLMAKMLVRENEFKSSVRASVFLGMGFLSVLMTSIWAIVTHSWVGLSLVVIVCGVGLWALLYVYSHIFERRYGSK
ncbi:MAG: 1-acyl-sn-glycerol-3-phosphate acyltransferase [Saprospiraceae bacterium]|nr:1-acyl-sn-glycerol-3-phosphate acyltransferase [Saprospiraceae bacterium]